MAAKRDGVYRHDIGCSVLAITNDFSEHTGILFAVSGHCVDMSGTISLFSLVDPDIKRIITFSGDALDTTYHKNPSGKWRCELPPLVAS